MVCPNCGKELKPEEVCGCNDKYEFHSWDRNSNEKLYSILSYIPFFWVIGLIAKPEKYNEYVKFHVGQGIIITIFWAAVLVLTGFVHIIFNVLLARTIIGGVAVGVGNVLKFMLGTPASLAILFLMVCGIVNVLDGRIKKVPFIGGLAFYGKR